MAVGKRSSERALQKVLGRGGNVNADNPLEVHDPKVGSLISYEGTTTADGAGDGSTLIDNVLTTKADYDGHWVVITSGPYIGQCSDITGATTGGTITAHTAFDGQILRGTNFVILAMKALPAEVAALTALVNALLADVGDASTATLGSLFAILGDPAQSFLAMIGYEGATALANKLTAARAALIDQITALRMAELDPANIPADIDTLLARVTAAVALASVCTAARLGELDAANLPATTDNILLDTQIRTIQSGAQAIVGAATEWLLIDSGTNGAEILSIAIKGLIGHDWTLATYVPTEDAVAAPAAGDKRDTIAYLAADTEGGLLKPFGIPFNAYLQFTNDGVNDDIDQVTITYRSRGALTLTWGP